jgi:hypothetical protein
MINIAMCTRRAQLFSIALVGAVFAPGIAHAQQNPSPAPIQPPRLSSGAGTGMGTDASGFGGANNPHDPEQARMLKDMSKERNAIRQKEIIDDTEHLLDLAKQLKDAVDKSSKDQLSLAVVNEAAEIEKLAKVVKEKMRDGQ